MSLGDKNKNGERNITFVCARLDTRIFVDLYLKLHFIMNLNEKSIAAIFGPSCGQLGRVSVSPVSPSLTVGNTQEPLSLQIILLTAEQSH